MVSSLERSPRLGRLLLAMVAPFMAASAWSSFLTLFPDEATARVLTEKIDSKWLLQGIAGLALLFNSAGFLRAILELLGQKKNSFGTLQFQWFIGSLGIATLLQVFAFQPFHMALLTLALAIGGGLFSSLYAFGSVSLPRGFGKVGALLVHLLFQGVVILGLSEVGLRLVARFVSTPLLSLPSGGVEDRIRHFRYPPQKVRYGYPTDKRGYFDALPESRQEATLLVACIGDSFSAGVVPHPYHYTTVCEKELRDTEVYNMGAPNLGPKEYHFLLREEALALEPDALVIGFFIGNDIHRPTRRLRSWFERDSVLLYQLPRRLWRIRKGVSDSESPSIELGAAVRTQEEAIATFPWVNNYQLEHPPFTERAFLELEIHRAKTTCRGHSLDYQQTFDVLLQMKEDAGDIPLIVMIIPDEFQVEERLWHQIQDATSLRDQDRFRPQEELGRFLDQEEILYVDLLPNLRQAEKEEDGARHVYHLQDTHFNAKGNRIAGHALSLKLGTLFPGHRKP